MMNYVYEPEVAAKIAPYVNYISPVKGVKEILEKTDPKLADNPLIFPPDDDPARAAPLPGAVARRRAHDEGGDGAGDGRLGRCCGSRCTGAAQLLPVAVPRPGPAVAAASSSRIPLLNQAHVSLMSGDPEHGYTFTWDVPHLQRRDLELQRAVPALDRLRRHRDDPLPDHRVPAGLLHRVQGGPLART